MPCSMMAAKHSSSRTVCSFSSEDAGVRKKHQSMMMSCTDESYMRVVTKREKTGMSVQHSGFSSPFLMMHGHAKGFGVSGLEFRLWALACNPMISP